MDNSSSAAINIDAQAAIYEMTLTEPDLSTFNGIDTLYYQTLTANLFFGTTAETDIR